MNYTATHLQCKEKMEGDLNGKTSIEIFETLFDEDVCKLILEQTQLYAMQKNRHDFKMTCEDLKIFVGILLLTGYHSLPRESMYWQMDEDTRTPLVSNNMGRNRFYEIKKNIHFADNDFIDESDKMAKIRPFINIMCQKFQHWGYMHENLSIDEAMVRYFGHHSAKQFIRGKPVRFGFKNCMLTSSCGYVYNLDTYCGAKNVDQSIKKLPLGSRVVLELLENVEFPSNHILYFDNFFTSHELLCKLKLKGFRATGTVRENRTKKFTLQPKKTCKSNFRGYCDYRYDINNKILFVQWNDNDIFH